MENANIFVCIYVCIFHLIGIPTISVIALLAVTVYISMDAVKVLYNPPKKDDVEVIYLYGFSCANMIVGNYTIKLRISERITTIVIIHSFIMYT